MQYKLIITIVKRGEASKIVAATKKSGAGGGTILLGRGTASQNIYLQILGMEYEPEKEIILTLVDSEKTGEILEVITKEAQLNKPGKGIAFVISDKAIVGAFHLLKKDKSK